MILLQNCFESKTYEIIFGVQWMKLTDPSLCVASLLTTSLRALRLRGEKD